MMKTQGVKDVSPLLVVAACFGISFSFLNSGYTASFSLNSPSHEVMQMFWSGEAGFSEEQSVRQQVIQGSNEFTLSFREIGNLQAVRVDPGRSKGRFELREATVSKNKCLLPIPKLCVVNLETLTPIWTNQVELSSDKYLIIESGGDDPGIAWNIPQQINHFLLILLLNTLVLSTLFIAGGMVLKNWGRVDSDKFSPMVWKAAIALTLYPIYLGFASVAFLYFGTFVIDKTVLLVSAGSFLGGIFVQSNLSVAVLRCPFRFNAAVLLAGLVTPDVMFHLGYIDHWRFGHEPNEYHWRLDRKFEDNIRRSSLLYGADIQRIGSEADNYRYFLADRATSLYITASEGLYSVNPMPHHRVRDAYLTDVEKAVLCFPAVEWGQVQRVLERLKVNLVVVNDHLGNPNVTQSCLARALRSLVETFSGKFSLKVRGRHLSLYEITDRVFD